MRTLWMAPVFRYAVYTLAKPPRGRRPETWSRHEALSGEREPDLLRIGPRSSVCNLLDSQSGRVEAAQALACDLGGIKHSQT